MLRRYASLGLALCLVVAGCLDAQAQTQRQRREQQRQQELQRQQEQQQQQQQQQQQEQPQPPQAQPPPAPPPPRAVERTPPGPPPVSLTVVTPPKSAAELAAEQQEREERSALNTRFLIFAAVLVAVGLLQFVAFGVQAFYLFLAMRAMQRTSRLTERNLTVSQRAFVFVETLTWSAAGENLKVVPSWQNNGVTPARSLRISTNWKAWHGELPADFPYAFTRAPDRVFLGPRARSDVGAVLIPMRDVQAALEQRVQLYFWGRATYQDVFDGTEPHFMEFCYRLDVAGGVPNAVRLTFSHYGLNNRADGDSMRPDDTP